MFALLAIEPDGAIDLPGRLERAGGCEVVAHPFEIEQSGVVRKTAVDGRTTGADVASGDGSCMLVVATDAPLDARDLGRLAARAVFGLGRTGSSFSNGSGDYAIAFSTSPEYG